MNNVQGDIYYMFPKVWHIQNALSDVFNRHQCSDGNDSCSLKSQMPTGSGRLLMSIIQE
jgi:hypothetical protein